MATECCPTEVRPAINNYEGFGKMVTIKDLFDMYIVTTTSDDANASSSPPTKAILLAYDIFGLTSNTKQLADHLATKCGKDYVVCVPDFMRGQAWPLSNIPPTKAGKFPKGVEAADGVDVLVNWIKTHPTCEKDRTDEIRQVKQYLTSRYKGLSKIGMVGMCWGAKVTFLAGSRTEGLLDCVASCHGSFLTTEDAEALMVPTCMLNSKDEPESYRTELQPILESKPFASQNVFREFPTMHHGWMGTRGVGADTDFTVEEIRAKYMEGMETLAGFFTGVMDK